MFNLSLSRLYLSVKRGKCATYGGSQMIFRDMIGKERGAKKKMQVGCGVVAFADLLWYLGLSESRWQKEAFTEDEYRRYFDEIRCSLGGLPPKFGLGVWQPAFHFNRIAIKRGAPYRAVWGLSIQRFHERLTEMLEADIPVYLCFPTILLPGRVRDERTAGVKLYRMKSDGLLAPACTVSSHYVVATGIMSYGGENWIQISSWGEKYYFNEKEYLYLLRHIPFGNMMGNLLYIRIITDEIYGGLK